MFEGLEMTQVGKMSAREPTRVELGEEGVACDGKEFRIAEGNSTQLSPLMLSCNKMFVILYQE